MQSLKSKVVNLLNEQSISSSDEQLSRFTEVKLLPLKFKDLRDEKFDKSNVPSRFIYETAILSTLPLSFHIIPFQVVGSDKSQSQTSLLLLYIVSSFAISFSLNIIVVFLDCVAIL